MATDLARAFRALAREGLDVRKDGLVYKLRRPSNPHAPEAEILLPEDFALEGKALHQLANFASAYHPLGGQVCAACATPDFHPGEIVPVGAVVATSTDIVIPQAIGSDINCGMRLHVADLCIDRFLEHKADLVEKLKGDLLLGTRNLPMTPYAMREMFRFGCQGWLEAIRGRPMGQLERSDLGQLEQEIARIYLKGSLEGDPIYAPEDLMPSDREVIRDGSLATVGGGNHFVELQIVEEVIDRPRAYTCGVRSGQIAFMVHSGSRSVGMHVGRRWMEKARTLWPAHLKYPESGIFTLHGEAVQTYMTAMATAANYGYINRLLLAELVRLRLREVYGGTLEVPLVFDVPHNVVFRERDRHVHRKGATPAHDGQLVLIPGSMGHPSYLVEGLGSARFLASASHGAGRATKRFEMRHKGDEEALGLRGIECITLKEERRIEEAPAAYKPIGPVVDIQVQAGIVKPVARMRPLLTFKG